MYALVDGITALVVAFRSEGASAKIWLVFTGIVGVIAGLLGIFRPLSSAVALAWVLGIWLMVRGVAEFASAFAEVHDRPRWLLIVGGAPGCELVPAVLRPHHQQCRCRPPE